MKRNRIIPAEKNGGGSHERRIIPRWNSAGFTLVEILIALFILAMVMAGTYRTLQMAMRLRMAAHHHYLSVIIANNRIERAKNIGFSDLPFLAENNVRVTDQGIPDSDGQFLRSTLVRMDHDGNPRLALMTVAVTPPSSHGNTRTPQSVSTLLTEYFEP